VTKLSRVPARAAALAAVAAGLALIAPGGATAQTGGIPTEGGGTAPAPSSTPEAPAPGDTPGGARISLRRAEAAPSRHLFDNGGRARFTWQLSGSGRVDTRVEVVRKSDSQVIRSYRKEAARPGVSYRVGWAGKDDRGHRAPVGLYYFRVRRLDNGRVVRAGAGAGSRWVKFYWARFPVAAPHEYGDGIGAPRSGHTHQGQDIFADCGARIVNVIGGRVQYRGYQAGGAGYYVVVDGRDGLDYVYMHLASRVKVSTGERVRTGDPIGYNGQTGNASGCHLHFEIWSAPGWYEGGGFINPTPKMKWWDSYS
jgi:murein DD-endopeptidase MepM/ murein hydrolase activator NlpD